MSLLTSSSSPGQRLGSLEHLNHVQLFMLVILPGVQHPTSAGEVDLQELLPEHLSQGGI